MGSLRLDGFVLPSRQSKDDSKCATAAGGGNLAVSGGHSRVLGCDRAVEARRETNTNVARVHKFFRLVCFSGNRKRQVLVANRVRLTTRRQEGPLGEAVDVVRATGQELCVDERCEQVLTGSTVQPP